MAGNGCGRNANAGWRLPHKTSNLEVRKLLSREDWARHVDAKLRFLLQVTRIAPNKGRPPSLIVLCSRVKRRLGAVAESERDESSSVDFPGLPPSNFSVSRREIFLVRNHNNLADCVTTPSDSDWRRQN